MFLTYFTDLNILDKVPSFQHFNYFFCSLDVCDVWCLCLIRKIEKIPLDTLIKLFCFWWWWCFHGFKHGFYVEDVKIGVKFSFTAKMHNESSFLFLLIRRFLNNVKKQRCKGRISKFSKVLGSIKISKEEELSKVESGLT